MAEIKNTQYIKLETSDKKKITSLLQDVIESETAHRIYTQKLSNGNFEVEIIEQAEEPSIN